MMRVPTPPPAPKAAAPALSAGGPKAGALAAAARAELRARAKTEAAQRSLHEFVRQAWPVLEPDVDFVDNWHLVAICDHLMAVTDRRIENLLCNVPPGTMKPCDVDGKVLEKDRGRIRLGDVRVGDKLLTHKGRFMTVKEVHEQGVLPVLKITTATGRVLRVEKSHPILTVRGWVPAGELSLEDYVAVVHGQEGCGAKTISNEEARILGYLIGDGCVKYSQTLFTNQTKGVIEDFCACAAAIGFPQTAQRKYRNKDVWNIRLLGGRIVRVGIPRGHKLPPNKLHLWLRRHNLEGRCSYDKEVPPAVMAGNEEVVANFLAAYWDCDGHMAIRDDAPKHPAIVSCCTVSEALADGILHLLSRLGMMFDKRRREVQLKTRRQGDFYVSFEVRACDQDTIAKFMERVAPHMRSGKAHKLKGVRRNNFQNVLEPDKVEAISEDGEALCRCLTVEGDHSFAYQDVAVKNSLLVCVFWLPWVWATQPAKRFIFSSYAEDLSLRDSMRTRRLLGSEWYQERWPLGFSESQDAKGKFENDKGGWRMVGSIGGKGTGEHPDFNCLPENCLVTTEHGQERISKVVARGGELRVLTFNHAIQATEWRRVTSFQERPGRPCVMVTLQGGQKLTCTEDHPVWCFNANDYLCPVDLRVGQSVMSSLGPKPGRREIAAIDLTAGTPDKVYNLAVEGNRNFFADGVLVHNCVDDPHNVLRAESDAERLTVTRWIEQVYLTRGVVRDVGRVMIMQRLHARDASGVVLEKGGWTHICLPMRFEAPRDEEVNGVVRKGVPRMLPTPLGWTDPRTKEGQLLWPKVYTEKKVATLEVNLGMYGAAGQLQQSPSPRGGGSFERQWFGVLSICPPLTRCVRYWDKAATKGGTGAESAGVLMGEYLDQTPGLPAVMRVKFVVVDIIVFRKTWAEREAVIRQTAELDNQLYPNVETWVEQEPGSGGKESAESTVANLSGFTVKIERVTGSKEVRAAPLAAQASIGRVKVLARDFTVKLLDELEAFPNGKLKDMVDGCSGGFNKMHQPTGAIDPDLVDGESGAGRDGELSTGGGELGGDAFEADLSSG